MTVQHDAATLSTQAKSFADLIRGQLDIDPAVLLEEPDEGGAVLYVVTDSETRYQIELTEDGRVLILSIRGKINPELKTALREGGRRPGTQTVFEAQSAHRMGDEWVLNFRSGPDGDTPGGTIEHLLDRLGPFLTEDAMASFCFRPFLTGTGSKLSACPQLSWSKSLKGFILV